MMCLSRRIHLVLLYLCFSDYASKCKCRVSFVGQYILSVRINDLALEMHSETVCQVVFPAVLPFSPVLLIGPSHMS